MVLIDDILLSSMVTHILIIGGSALGSIKANYIAKQEGSRVKFDIYIGIFCGAMLGYHYLIITNAYITGLVSLAGGASGVLVLNIIIDALPEQGKNILSKLLKKIIGD